MEGRAYPVGSDPNPVTVGDFNGDGIPDLAVGNLASNTVSVLLGNGDGTFQAAVTYSVGYGPASLAVADLNGDGKLDLAVANYADNTVSVLLGNGDGTFQAAVNFIAGSYPVSIAVGNFNGKPDLAVADAGGRVLILLNTTPFSMVNQTIAFGALLNRSAAAAPFTVSATASSGLPVSFNSQTTSVCMVSGPTVTLISAGTCTIQATQAGNGSYAPATPVNQSFQVTLEGQTIAFGALANQPLNAAPFTVSATASSGLPVSFNSQTTSVCTVSGATVTLVALGTCTIQATQAGNANYAPATPVNQSFQVTLESQTITFAALANQQFGTSPFPVSASASSGLPVSFNSQTTSICTVSGATVTLIAPGKCTIQATQAGNATYAPAMPVNQSFQVLCSLCQNFAIVTNYNDNTVSVIATSSNTVVATVGVGDNPYGVALTPDGSHAYVDNYSDNTVSVIATSSNAVIATVAVGNSPNGIAITPDGTRAYVANSGDNTVSVIATSSNTVIGQPVSVGNSPYGVAITPDGTLAYVPNSGDNTVSVIATSSNTVVATVGVGITPSAVAITPDGTRAYVPNINDNTVTVIATSSNTVIGTPIEVGNNPYGIAITPDGAFAYVPNANDNTVSVIATSSNTVAATVGVGGFPYGVAITPDGTLAYVANVNDNTVSVIATSSNTVVATVGVGNEPVEVAIFQVTQANQTITFAALANQPLGAAPFTVSATASSGLPVSFNSQTMSVCTVSGTTATLVAVGTCTIQATQAGNANYAPATPVNQSFQVTQANQTITFAALANQPLGAAPFTVSATASSGLPVSFNSQTTSVCTVSGATVTLVAVGICTIQATQAGNANYAPATPVSQSFQVTQGSQTITFHALANKALGALPFTVSATASSGLPVSFNSQTTSVCTVSGTTVTLVALGTCTIQATQAGNANYAPATPVNQSFQVVQPVTVTPATLAFGSQGLQSPTNAKTVTVQNNTSMPVNVYFQITGTNGPDFQLTPATTCGSTLAAQSSCTISVLFDPQATGARSATLSFSGTPDQTQPSVNLTGTGVLPVTVTPATLAFGSQGLQSPTNAKTVTVQNNTSMPVNVYFQITGTNGPDFQLTPATTCGSTLAAQSSCTISVLFDPQATGARSATLSFSGTPDQTQPSVNLTGTGVLPVTVTPATLAFGSQGLQSPTNAKTVTVQNNTSMPVNVYFQITGTNGPDFQLTPATTCGSTLAAQSSCTISVLFDPQATGARSATLSFSGTPDQTQPSVNLTGTGVLPVTVTPATLAFGSQGLQSPTNAKTVTVQNNTSMPVNVYFQITGTNGPDFQLTPATTCGSTLAAQSSCTISVLFDPQATGARSATLSFSGTPDQTQPSVNLTGTGVLPVTVTPATLAFGSQGLQSPTNAKTVTVQNNTSMPVNVYFQITGTNGPDFQLTPATTCGSTLAAQSSCTISVLFDPQATGARSATLSFSGTPDQTQPSVNLTGTGVLPVTVTPATLAFGSQGLQSPTNAKTVTVQNNTSMPVNVYFQITGTNGPDFQLTPATTCGSTLAAQSSCTISVLFDPQATGARSATLSFSGTPDQTQPSVNLTGTGVLPVTVTPATLAFGSQGLQSPTNAKTVTVQNNTSMPVNVYFQITGTNGPDFQLTPTTTCGSTLAAQSSCTISVLFDPQATGARSATLSFSGTPDQTQPSVNLTGTGVLPVTVTPATLAFGSQGLQSPTNAKTVTVQNNTSMQVNVYFQINGTNGPDFQLTPTTTCGSTLAAQSSCTISVLFDPQATGARSATLSFSSTPDQTQPSVNLTGTGVLPVTVTPASLPFGRETVNTFSLPRTVTVQNNTNLQTNLSFGIGGADPNDFVLGTTTCGPTLAAQSSCTINVEFDPQAAGARSATLNFSGTPDQTQPSVNLTGTGT